MKNLKATKKIKNKIYINFYSFREYNFDFDNIRLNKLLIKTTLDRFNLHYDFSVNISLVNNAKIKSINKLKRNIDKATDVLSFPNIYFTKPLYFKPYIKKDNFDISIVDLNTKSIFLGDIILNIDKVIYQSKVYGHSIKREYSFLIIHSMLHLLGYDHMVKKDEKIMFDLQNKILNELKIKR